MTDQTTPRTRRRACRPALPGRRPNQRRGVLLLVVLSMLVLFLLVGATFLITSEQYRSASKTVEKQGRVTFQPADLLERALMQLVRDTGNRYSALRYHSLLRDLYGVDGFAARIATASPVAVPTPITGPHFAGARAVTPAGVTSDAGATGQRLVELYVLDDGAAPALDPSGADRNAVGLDIDENGLPLPHFLSRLDGKYEGCVLTVLDGPCRGSSVRVVRYEFVGAVDTAGTPAEPRDDQVVGKLTITAPVRSDGRPLGVDADGVITDLVDGNLGRRVIVNGRPYNGAGVGLNALAGPGQPALSALETVGIAEDQNYGLELALTPHARDYVETANAIFDPRLGIDPWRPVGGGFYPDAAVLPLSRGFTPAALPGGAPNPDYDAETSPLYKTYAGPGDTDESYDAADYQNLFLALQSPEPRPRGRVAAAGGAPQDPEAYYAAGAGAAPAYVDTTGLPIPSFHRPALANFWFHRLYASEWLAGLAPDDRVRAILAPYDAQGQPQFGLDAGSASGVAAIKRRFLLRPLREDHPDFDGGNPASRYGAGRVGERFNDPATPLVNQRGAGVDDDEITFPTWETTGPWDVDNDGDGVPDSVWVDLGLPVQKTEDGRFYKPLVAMLVEDLDGRLNLNAHGGEHDLATLDPSAATPQNLDGSQRGGFPMVGNLPTDTRALAARLPGGALASDFGTLRTSNQLPQGSGWGPAEVSLRPVLSPTLPVDEVFGGSSGLFVGNAQYDDYARLLAGRPDPREEPRAAALALRRREPWGRYGSRVTGPIGTGIGSQVSVPWRPGRGVLRDAPPALIAKTRDSLARTELTDYPKIAPVAVGPAPFLSTGPTSFASPADLRSRFADATTVAATPLFEPDATANSGDWRDAPESTVDDTPYELDLSAARRRIAPGSFAAVARSYDADADTVVDPLAAPIDDDSPFSPAELERVLRAFDADADRLEPRLWNLIDSFDPEKLAAAGNLGVLIRGGANPPVDNPNYLPSSLESLVASARAAINRRVVTTESFDLPVPHEDLRTRLALGADGLPGLPGVNDEQLFIASTSDTLVDEGDEAIVGYNADTGEHVFRDSAGNVGPATYDQLWDNGNGSDDYVVVMREDPPAAPRLIDYLRYRVTLQLLRDGRVTFDDLANNRPRVERVVGEVLYGADRPVGFAAVRNPQAGGVDDAPPADVRLVTPPLMSYGGLLAPEVLAGRRMDLNRPLGDGRDNNGNGIVDEPAEAGEPSLDANGDGQIGAPVVGAAPGEYLDLDRDGRLYGDFNGNGVVFRDTDGDGGLDDFEPADIDADSDGVVDRLVLDHHWVDANRDGLVNVDEVRPLEHCYGLDVSGGGAFLDRVDGDTRHTAGEPMVRDDARLARQLYARHLYCLMLALMDENYLAPYDAEDPQVLHYLDPLSGPSDLSNYNPANSDQVGRASMAFRLRAELVAAGAADTPATWRLARRRAWRKLTCRRVAQWAVNVVDFRDPDAIQTPLEYDENPWDGWNVVDTQGTPAAGDDLVFPLDGDLATDEGASQARPITAAGFGAVPDPIERSVTWTDNTRGVVWGAERPELLITEGLAWHDRRLEDRQVSLVADGGKVGQDGDDDLDQLRKPKGFCYLEAYNPWLGEGGQRPAELYSHVDRTGAALLEAGVRLDRLSDAAADLANPTTSRSPVWRFVCVEEHPLVRNSTAPPTVTPLASDDPPNDRTAAAGAQAYNNVTIRNLPWVYPSPRDPYTYGGTATSSASASTDVLAEAYRVFGEQKRIEMQAALTTSLNDVTIGLTDADGVRVPIGVLENPPTLPDTAWPQFDRIRQPELGTTAKLTISSRVDGIEDGTEDGIKDASGNPLVEEPTIRAIYRGISQKPTRFIERAFYPVAARQWNPGPGTSGSPFTGVASDNLNPGFRIPELLYEVPVETAFPVGRLGDVGANSVRFQNAIGRAKAAAIVSASKFGALYDRMDLDGDMDRGEVIPLAPILPGRAAVVGTAGSAYQERFDPATPLPPGAGLASFTGEDALQMARRYVTVISQPINPIVEGGGGLGRPVGAVDPLMFQYLGLKRFEMIPSGLPGANTASPDVHQFAIRMNGLTEGALVRQANGANSGTSDTFADAFNATLGLGVEQNDPTRLAAPPVVVAPMDGFSLSEPLDGYVLRQLELEKIPSSPAHYLRPNGGTRRGAVPIVDYYSGTSATDLLHFDEPFDLLPELVENQTTPNYRSMHLERLANPLLPWNPPPVQPDGTAHPQHDAALAVNPYLPVDAHAMDLTAFNSFNSSNSDNTNEAGLPEPPASTEFVHVPDGGETGPEARHRRKRFLPDGTGTIATAWNLIARERSRGLGPFRPLWFVEPARLLWGQAPATTTAELVHTFSRSLGVGGNGYRYEARDAIRSGPAPSGRTFTEHDSVLLGNRPYKEQSVDFPWRTTLGLPSGDWGEFFTGSALVWGGDADGVDYNAVTMPQGAQADIDAVDVEGDGAILDMISAPEINEVVVLPDGSVIPDFVNGQINDSIDRNADGLIDEEDRTLALEALRDNVTVPQFNWPNRPFASAGELLQVPAWGSSRMLTRYGVYDWLRTQKPGFLNRTQVNPYNGEASVAHDGVDYDPTAPTNRGGVLYDGDYSNDGSEEDTDNSLDDDATNRLRWRETLGHFGHLANFFQTARFPARIDTDVDTRVVGAAAQPTSVDVPLGAAHQYRLLDYVTVPSRFTGSQEPLGEVAFAEAALPPGDPRRGLAAPHNRLDRYREPGRVNLNTVVGRQGTFIDPDPASNEVFPDPRDWWSDAYDGLMHRTRDGAFIDFRDPTNPTDEQLLRLGHGGPAWRDVALSRRGYVQPTFDPTQTPLAPNRPLLEFVQNLASDAQNQIDYSPRRMHPGVPTFFANPFRAPGEGANVPLAHLVQTGVDATLLRAHPLSPGADSAWGARGVDEGMVDRGDNDDDDPDPNDVDTDLVRDDAGEAGVALMTVSQNGGVPAATAAARLTADVPLTRFRYRDEPVTPGGATGALRGMLPDTFVEDAFRGVLADANPRETAPGDGVRNAEIAKRTTPVPLFSAAALEPSIDTERNPSLRYRPIQRMANLATTRSGVFAVWITVGFFEVTPAREDPRVWPRYMTDTDGDGAGDTFVAPNANRPDEFRDFFFRVYQDGWMLGAELGADTGESRRHRGFYLIDRTRPVAFRPGLDANVSETVLLRRRLE